MVEDHMMVLCRLDFAFNDDYGDYFMERCGISYCEEIYVGLRLVESWWT